MIVIGERAAAAGIGLAASCLLAVAASGCGVASNSHRVTVHAAPSSFTNSPHLPAECAAQSATTVCLELAQLVDTVASAATAESQSTFVSFGGGGRFLVSTTLRGDANTDARVRQYLVAHGWRLDNTSRWSTLRRSIDGWAWVANTMAQQRGALGIDVLQVVANPPGASPR